MLLEGFTSLFIQIITQNSIVIKQPIHERMCDVKCWNHQ